MTKVLRYGNLAGALLLAGMMTSSCAQMQGMMGKGGGMEHVTLSGSNEVPAVSSSASGSGTVTIGSDHSVEADITVSGMTPTAAHIHQGAAGANGPVIVPLTKQGADHFVAPAGAKLSDAQYEAYEQGKLYVNVHSAAHPGGEIRAQLKGSY